MASVRRTGECIINLIFPPKCIFCGRILNFRTYISICDGCYRTVDFINNPHPAIIETEGSAGFCDGVVCLFRYSGRVKESLLRYKFHDRQSYFRTYARLMLQRIKGMKELDDLCMIMAVPLHKKREKIRGYNQSHLISKAFASEAGIPERSELLVRKTETHTQSSLSRSQRATNIKNAFMVRGKEYIKGKNVLLIDDILTTGSTINECCRVLKDAGAKKVFAAVVASGRRDL